MSPTTLTRSRLHGIIPFLASQIFQTVLCQINIKYFQCLLFQEVEKNFIKKGGDYAPYFLIISINLF